LYNFFVYTWKILPDLIGGLKITIGLSVICISLGIIVGIFLGVARVYSKGFIYWLVTAYVEFIRGTPCLVQLLLIYYGLGDMGIFLKPIVSVGIALALNSSAYQAEYLRGAILSVRPGQVVASRALGLSKWGSIMYVILPQAMRLVVPSSSNEIVLMIKTTSLAFVVGLPELMSRANSIAFENFKYIQTFLITAAIYIIVVLFIAKALDILERKTKIPGLQMKQG